MKARFLSMLAFKVRFEGPLYFDVRFQGPLWRPALKARAQRLSEKRCMNRTAQIPLPQQSRRLYCVVIQFITWIAATTPDAKTTCEAESELLGWGRCGSSTQRPPRPARLKTTQASAKTSILCCGTWYFLHCLNVARRLQALTLTFKCGASHCHAFHPRTEI